MNSDIVFNQPPPDHAYVEFFDGVDETLAQVHALSISNAITINTHQTREPEFILDGLIQAGFVLLAGMHGSGKTSIAVPLATKVAHLCPADDPLRPTLRRHVIYVAEDTRQVSVILAAMRAAGKFEGIDDAEIAKWFHIIEARRMPVSKIIMVAREYARLTHRNERNGATYDAQPLVIIDTLPATIDLEQENDNSEASKAVAMFKQGFAGIPVIAISHMSKSMKRADVKDVSARGASAWEADANQVVYLVDDEALQKRVIEIGGAKHRFTEAAACIIIERVNTDVPMIDVFGQNKTVPVTFGEPVPASREQMAAEREVATEARIESRLEGIRIEAKNEVERVTAAGGFINRTGLKAAIAGRGEDKSTVIQRMMNDRWLVAVDVRDICGDGFVLTNSRRSEFLISLTPAERDQVLEGGALPERARQIPDGWVRRKRNGRSAADETGTGAA